MTPHNGTLRYENFWRSEMPMNSLFLILLFIFGGVALMVVLGEKFAKPMDGEKMQKLSRWILPLVAISIVVQLIYFYTR
jgi:cadmium resistance protein CadD (predicted permease)